MANYVPLTIGSYWVYEWVKVDTFGVESPVTFRDSVFISGDTLINGEVYSIVDGTFLGSEKTKEFHRDSSGYLVNEKGETLFNPNNNTDLLWTDTIFVGEDPFVLIEYSMEGATTDVTVPAGTFNCLNFQGKVISLEDDYPWGTRYTGYYYADGIAKSNRLFFLFQS